ncbi:MAG: sulfotransferase [Candidatus Omnitrophota bacterium]
MKCGYLYVASGKKYVEEAIVSASSLRRVDTQAHITLVADQETNNDVFNRVIIRRSPPFKNWCEAHLYKARHVYQASPYQKTLFLDTDTYFYENCRPLFGLLDHFDLCLAATPADDSEAKSNGRSVAGCTPYNSGVILYRKNWKNDLLFNKWAKILERRLSQGIEERDQTCLMEALIKSRSRAYVLPNVWNARTPFFINLLGTVKIVHGRHPDYEALRSKINITPAQRCWDPYRQTCIVPPDGENPEDPLAKTENRMLVTVAICTRNRSQLLSQALESMKRLVIPPDVEWELLIVNNDCTDATDDVIGSFRSSLPIRRLFEPKPGKSNALNLAAREARGEYILWTDDDCRVDPRWLDEYCRAFKLWPDTAIFGGSVSPHFEGTPPLWLRTVWRRVAVVYAERDFEPEPFPLSRWVMPYGANLAVRTLEQRQYAYDPRLGPCPGRFIRGGEESTVVQKMLKAGIKGRWTAGAKVFHLIPKKRQKTGYLRRCLVGHGEILSMRLPDTAGEEITETDLLLETPYLLWKKALLGEWRYRVRRILDAPKVWVEDLASSSIAWGMLLGRITRRPAIKKNDLVFPTPARGTSVQRVRSGQAPVFIVGVPRSGTTLLAAMLGAHSRLSCGPETQLFVAFLKISKDSFYDARSWPESGVEILSSVYKIAFGGRHEPIFESFGLTKDEIMNYLRDHPPSIAALLSSLTEQHMKKLGKKRWVEKTPLHLTNLGKIRRCFPESPIIRIVRDPRDSALSHTKTPWGPSTFFGALVDWKKLDGLSSNFFEKDPLAYTVRYEDLIESPEEELKKVCEFIGESFEPAMLDTSRSLPSMKPKSWHLKAGEPIDKTRTAVWKKELSESENRMAEALLGDRLKAYGYPSTESFRRVANVVPQSDVLQNCPGLVYSLAGQGVRFWKTEGDRSAGPLIYGGIPDSKEWRLGQGTTARLSRALETLFDIVRMKLTGQEVYWICGESPNGNSTISSKLLCSMLAPFKKAPE